MNKKLMAIAVAGVFAVPAVALAQKSTVEIYGRANLGIDTYQAKGSATAANDRDSRIRIYDGSSRVGFRGTEDLGGGLRAIFQIETGVNIDNGSNTSQSGGANTSTGFWASRDSFVGLDSNFGRVTFGRQSIYWANGVNAQFAANYINTEIPWTNGTQLGRISAGVAVARQSDTLQYTTPTFGGFNGTVSYSPSAQEPVQSVPAGSKADGDVLGVTLRGTFGAFYGQFDWAKRSGNTTAGAQSEADFYKLGGSWGYMPGARIGLIWVRTELNATASATPAPGGGSVDQDGWTLNWEHTFGNIQLMAQYGEAMKMKGCTVAAQCDNTKATGIMIGGRYFLSKRTWVYASYNEVDNKANQFADYVGGGITSTTGAPTPLGADPRIIALGLFHAF